MRAGLEPQSSNSCYLHWRTTSLISTTKTTLTLVPTNYSHPRLVRGRLLIQKKSKYSVVWGCIFTKNVSLSTPFAVALAAYETRQTCSRYTHASSPVVTWDFQWRHTGNTKRGTRSKVVWFFSKKTENQEMLCQTARKEIPQTFFLITRYV